MENLADDPNFIDAIVHEVKSQGLFDQFRKECLADVDTKPAYQNLRQRVESSVGKFLSQQKWIDNIRHKNQLREKLRRNIIDSGFLDTGVERIVDQVVNPKISTVFHPKVEEIVYNYLGIEKPKAALNGGAELDVQTDFLPEDLEAVSPDSDKKSTTTSSDLQPTMEQSTQEELNESKEHLDDFESPAFEPLEPRPPSQTKHDSNDSSASAISGLTSQESVENESNEPSFANDVSLAIEKNPDDGSNGFHVQPINTEQLACSTRKESPEVAQNDSQLSQVSSNSRLSIITSSERGGNQHNNQIKQTSILEDSRLDITEEAQMPNFHENSNEDEGELENSNDGNVKADCKLETQKSNFDLKQEVYDFKCTERNRYTAAEIEGYKKERNSDIQDSVENAKVVTHDGLNERRQNTKSPIVPTKFEETSSHSERSLRICEDSTLEQRGINNSDQLENFDSVKTPLNDEHSTESAPDVEKMDASQIEVISLASVKHHNSNKDSKKDRHRGRDKHSSSHRHRSSSSRDERRSHSSSKHSSSNRKSNHRDRKHENGNSNSNFESSRKNVEKEKRKDNDDHYSEHEKPAKRRRSTDRDSNDGAENGTTGKSTGESTVRHTENGNVSVKTSKHSEKRAGGETKDKLNESLDSNFEGFDEEQLFNDSKKMDYISKVISKSCDKDNSKESSRTSKKIKKYEHKSSKEIDRKNGVNMDIFSFSFEKPAKLINDEMCHDKADLPGSEEHVEKQHEELSTTDSIDLLEEGVIILEPSEIAKIIKANEQQTVEEAIISVDIIAAQNNHQANPEDLVTLATQPVVVDQMLTNGDNMDLELLIGEKRLCGDETTLNTIKQGLDVVKNKVKRPKIASNFDEARKLMKVRKQMERDEKKKREQALVLAKRLINENRNENEDDQGIELEFVCDGNRISSAPIISSPMRPKSRPNFEEPVLLYFKEEEEVFPVNENLLELLKLKTANVSVPDDFLRSNNRLVSLYTEVNCPEQPSSRNILSELENAKPITTKALFECVKYQKSKTSNPSCTSKHVGSDTNTKFALDNRASTNMNSVEFISFHTITSGAEDLNSTNQLPIESTGSSKDSCSNHMRPSKTKRLGLPKPRTSLIPRSSTAILTVDISDVKPINQDKGSPGNNNIIGTKRYSSDDLYKPRSLTSRTRTRANEQIGI